MDIADLITPRSVVASLRAANKKQLLQELAKRAAPPRRLDEKAVFDTLLERERLGSTGIGSGTAVPHGRLPTCTRIFGLFARLEKPIPFEAVDDQPVDLVFLLLTPDGAGADHLKALARDLAPVARPRGLREAARHRPRRGALRAPHRPHRQPRRLNASRQWTLSGSSSCWRTAAIAVSWSRTHRRSPCRRRRGSRTSVSSLTTTRFT